MRLAALLPEPNALIGALAVSAHGYVRATDDVDFASPADPREIQARLADADIESSVRRRGNVLDGDLRSCVFGVLDGVRFDILFPPVPIDWTKTILLPISRGSRVRVVDLDALLRLKLRAGGPQDLIDVVQLVRRHPETESMALAGAAAYGLKDRIETWLADPRIRSPEPIPPLPPGSAGSTPGRRRRSR